MSRWTLLAIVVLASGCQNACQGACREMAKAAENCGITVSAAEMESCIAEEAGAPRADRKVCATIDAESIAADWDCNEIGSYFGTTSPSDTDTE